MNAAGKSAMRAMALASVAAWASISVEAQEMPVAASAGGRLRYVADATGNRVPDFSHCGYRGGDEPIPNPAATVYVVPVPGDDGATIQAAIDRVANLSLNENDIRGVVRLGPGRFEVAGDLRITHSGVVLRGSGADPGGTTIVATGKSRRPLLRIGSSGNSPHSTGQAVAVVDDYVPVGATQITLADSSALSAGDRILVVRPSTDEWIDALGARAPGIGWRPGRCDIRWDRVVTSVDGNEITIDAPITTAIDRAYGGATVARIGDLHWPSVIGVENLCLSSEYNPDQPGDEEHSWFGIVAQDVESAWIRLVRFEHFAGGAVLLREGTKWISVEDCLSLDPVSELGGYRRHTFFTQGQQSLFLRCYSRDGRHDFSVGHCAPGPNAFVNCYAANAHADSGPLESWASGVLYDNVRIDGNDLTLGNRWARPPGAGWSAANCVLWQCQAAKVSAYRPPTANNWVLGYWAEPEGNAMIVGQSDFVRPISLFQAQLRDRLGDAAASRVDPLLLDPIASTNPSVAQAQEFVAASVSPARTLRNVIESRMEIAGATSRRTSVKSALPSEALGAGSSHPHLATNKQPIEIVNGWLTIDGRVLTGGHVNPTWWRGTLRPEDAEAFGPSITRFAPGRYDTGLTDELGDVVAGMLQRDQVVYDHHYGLWYDRRRDDHLMVRRATAEVAPPFYEQPFARTGRGKAWDGLSRYDLTRYNSWYWSRLTDFAKLCDEHGRLLMHQHYFQHNILEAGGHWVDCPWRPTNNVNETDFPEPPPFVGDKRIFIARQFYDTTHARRVELHRAYIKHCLQSFASSRNVMHSISAEYTGPEDFTRFWLSEVRRWSEEQVADPLVALSTTKDVQDSLLADEHAAEHVDVIDIRYWCYDRSGEVYAPRGGINLSPRQQLRQSKRDAADFASIARAVREYRLRYPEKAVTYFADRYCRSPRGGWAALMGGGSLAAVPPLPEELERAIPQMLPVEQSDRSMQQLAKGGESYLIHYSGSSTALEVDLPNRPPDGYQLTWIDPQTGKAETGPAVDGGPTTIVVEKPVLWIQGR